MIIDSSALFTIFPTDALLDILANGLVIASVIVMIAALFPVRQLISRLPDGTPRRRWGLMAGMIFIFIFGYSGFLAVFWDPPVSWTNLIVPVIFFFGAAFVWLSARLSLQTAEDMKRVTALERDAVTDPVLGIYNRRYLVQRLEEEFDRAQRYQEPLSVILLDLDRFKHVNDTLGHPAGDQVLYDLGQLLAHAVRLSDIVARYGGDELLVIAPNTSPLFAVELAERLRQIVEQHLVKVMDASGQYQTLPMTLSAGVASLALDDLTSQSLVHHADEALYSAKQEGRNRVVFYGSGRNCA